MVEFVSAALLYQIYDPAVWVAFALGGALGRSRVGLLLGLAAVLLVAGYGWVTVIQYQYDVHGNSPPLGLAVIYFLGKILAFAFGVALNRLILRIEKRSARVLEKART